MAQEDVFKKIVSHCKEWEPFTTTDKTALN